MSFEKYPLASIPIPKHVIRWLIFSVPLAAITGSLVALFLWSLDMVADYHREHGWLLFLLPAAGIVIHFLYHCWGQDAERGNNLIIDEIHEPGGGVPWRMAPLALATTLITHLFGGSAGREGTAVQMGGSIAYLLRRWLKLSGDDARIILTSGIAGGFGAVFGTPLAGTVFALEVPASGRMNYKALLPCLMTATLSDIVCRLWGIVHMPYAVSPAQGQQAASDYRLMVQVVMAGILFGMTARAFTTLSHSVRDVFSRYIRPKWLIPVAGGLIVIALTFLAGTRDYLGLGVFSPDRQAVTIVSCFREGGAGYFSWLWKLVFTVITLSAGFKGGEVTPLFFIGAALGNTIAILTGAPTDLMAALGFIAVFAGATNTPLACTLMGIELFGGAGSLYYAAACFTAYYFSGSRGIYSAQRSDGLL